MQIPSALAMSLAALKRQNSEVAGRRWAGNPARLGVRVAGLLAALFILPSQASAAIATWTGANSNLWNNTGNWSSLPAASGDSLVFQGPGNLNNTNNISGSSYANITFNNSGWVLGGNAFTLTGLVTANGNAVMNMNINYSGNKIFGAGTGATLALAGNITGGAQFRTNLAGTVILSGTNSFGGDIQVNSANSTLQFSSSSNVGTSALVINSLATLSYVGNSNTTLNNTLAVSSGGASKFLSSSGNGAIKFAGAFSNTSDQAGGTTLVLTGTNTGNNEIAGNIGNSTASGNPILSVNKSGNGRWILSGGNTYTGTTSASVGTLLVNGSHTNAGNYTVSASATLGGSGVVAPGGGNNITVSSNGVLAPGAGLGTFTINSGSSAAVNILSLQSGALLSFELNSTGPGNFQSDTVALINGSAGDISFADNVINFSDLSLGTLTFGNYLLFTANVAGAYSGLTLDGNGVIIDGLFIGGGLGSYDGSVLKVVGNDIYLSVVPEPETGALLAGTLAVFAVARRRVSLN